ncbi:MAG: mechanosensitive ion channel family protein [Gammaproteobacteria bacterium]
MEFSEKFTWLMDYLREDAWIVQVFAVIFIALLIDLVQKRVIKKLYERLKHTGNFWDDALVDAIRTPASVLIWLLGLTFAGQILRTESDAVIFDAVAPIREVGIVFILAWALVRFIRHAEQNIVSKNELAGKPIDRTTADAIAKLLRISVIITAGLVILQTLGYSISGVLAFGGISGIAIGFAAKDLLANFFGGLMIYLDRPFAVGDWVRSPDKEIEGTVENIGWRLTRIRTFDKRPLYVPNSVFTTISVENPSRMTNRRILETVGIRYDDAAKMAAIVSDVKQMLREHPEIDTNLTMIVNFNKFAASSLDFFVYTFTKTKEWIKFHEIKQDVMLKIIDIIDKHGAECAFPTSTIHVPEGIAVSDPGEKADAQEQR